MSTSVPRRVKDQLGTVSLSVDALRLRVLAQHKPVRRSM
jgi:hypothetical protein